MHDGPPPVDDVVLIVSELVANAVRAGSTTILLVLSADESGTKLSVEDDAAGVPVARNPTQDSTGGRGLRIVEALADAWTTGPVGEDRKRVTALWRASA